MVDEKTLNCLNDVAISVHSAKHYFDMWRVLNGEQTRPKYVDILNHYLYFSRALIASSFHFSVINLYKAVETSSNTHNLKNLLILLDKSEKISSEKLNSIKGTLSAHEKAQRAVFILRSNVSAHHSEKIKYQEAFKKADISPDELKSLINTLVETIDDIYSSLDISGRQSTGKAAQELEQLLEDLKSFHTGDA